MKNVRKIMVFVLTLVAMIMLTTVCAFAETKKIDYSSSITVKVVWDDERNTSYRPVTIKLVLKRGEEEVNNSGDLTVSDTVEHTFDKLDDGDGYSKYTYTVEQVGVDITKYDVEREVVNGVMVITNTLKESVSDYTETTSSSDSEDKPTASSDNGDKPTASSDNDNKPTEGSGNGNNTGQSSGTTEVIPPSQQLAPVTPSDDNESIASEQPTETPKPTKEVVESTASMELTESKEPTVAPTNTNKYNFNKNINSIYNKFVGKNKKNRIITFNVPKYLSNPNADYKNIDATPTTGDNSNIILWFIILIITSGLLITFGIILLRNKRKE